MLPYHYNRHGERHTGNDVLDCEQCRADLLDAFRAPAEVPEPVKPDVPAYRNPEHIIVPPERTRTVDIGRPEHSTWTALVQPPGSPAVQTAICSCGWTRELALPADFPEETARVMAEGWALDHRTNPKPQEDQ